MNEYMLFTILSAQGAKNEQDTYASCFGELIGYYTSLSILSLERYLKCM